MLLYSSREGDFLKKIRQSKNKNRKLSGYSYSMPIIVLCCIFIYLSYIPACPSHPHRNINSYRELKYALCHVS